MKTLLLAAAFSVAALTSYAQTDSTVAATPQPDTIRIGTMIIIKKDGSDNMKIQIGSYHRSRRQGRIQSRWCTLDIGFNNFSDKTNYSSAEAKDYARAVRPGEADMGAGDFNLRNGRSVNINLWIYRQRFGLTRNNKLSLSYGLVAEWNNYRWDNNTSFVKGTHPYAFRDSINFKKNKLAVDYFSVPLMLGFNSRPKSSKGFTVEAGVSLGYMYNSRTKQTSNERGRQKEKGNFDVKDWKFQYVAELGMGWAKLYGTYSPSSMFQRGLDFRPYSIGLRFGDWD